MSLIFNGLDKKKILTATELKRKTENPTELKILNMILR